jgi:hypothetical protein
VNAESDPAKIVVSDWQLDSLLRRRALENAAGSLETLKSIVKLVDQLSDMPVGPDVRDDVQESLAALDNVRHTFRFKLQCLRQTPHRRAQQRGHRLLKLCVIQAQRCHTHLGLSSTQECLPFCIFRRSINMRFTRLCLFPCFFPCFSLRYGSSKIGRREENLPSLRLLHSSEEITRIYLPIMSKGVGSVLG